MAQLHQSAAYTRMVLMVGSSDHVTGLAGATLTITASKAGGAFASITPTVTDRGSGWYSLALTTAHTDTLGDFVLHITATSADPTDVNDQIIAQDLMTANVSANVVQIDGVANSTHTAGMFPADARNVEGAAYSTHTAGYLPADLRQIAGAAASATTAQLGVNVVNWNNSVVATPNSAGVPVVDDRSNAMRINTATAVAAGSITLDAGASATDNYYNDCMVVVLSGTTGAGQARLITGYTGSTKVATVSPNWTTTPTGTIVFAVIALSRVDVAAISGTIQSARDIGANIDTTISSRQATVTFPANFSSLAITAGGATTVGTNNDKTGYSLTQTFPTNFSSLAITAGGAVTAGTVSDKTGYSLTQAFPTNFSSLTITVGGAVTAGTVSDKTGYSLAAGGQDLSDRMLIRANTLQAATGTSATLDAGASATDGFYVGQMLVAGSQARRITAYTGATKVATLTSAWTTAPGAVAYSLLSNVPTVDVGSVAGTAQTARDLGANIDTTISSRLATAGYTAPDNTSVAAIKTKTDYLPSATAGAAGGILIAGTNAATSFSGSGITATFTGNLTGSVASVTGNVGGSVASVTGAVGSVVARVTANVDQIEGSDATDQIRDSVFNGVVEGTTTLAQFMRGMIATLLGKASGMATTSVSFRDQADSKNRVVAIVDSNGNRTSVTLDLS
jgi:hypothetical protein